jgi:hypothetical protein
MASTHPKYDKAEFARCGYAIFERDIRDHLRPTRENQFVAIDIESGGYEVADDELTASDRLMTRIPDAQIWLRRVGSRYSCHFGRMVAS